MSALYHGGQPGIAVGALILPPCVTGAPASDRFADYEEGVYRNDRVYLCTDMNGAALFAAMHYTGWGFIYEVEAIGEVESDLDWHGEEGGSVMAESARVTKVIGRPVFLEEIQRLFPGSLLTRPGRNDRCPCGSGKKFKRCCASVQEVAA